MPRIAVIDLMFSWPPHGGGCVDIKNTCEQLVNLGHTVKIFVPRHTSVWPRGSVIENHGLPFEVEIVPFGPFTFNRFFIAQKFRDSVDAFKPDYLFLSDSAFFKPALINGFAHLPTVARFYTYELLCPNYYQLFKNGKTCEIDYLQAPKECLQCAMETMAGGIRNWKLDLWSHEFVMGLGFTSGYYREAVEALKRCRHLIVYNHILKERFEKINPNVRVVSGGINLADFPVYTDEKPDNAKKKIFLAGRTDDWRKGFGLLSDAAKMLAEKRDDFEVYATFKGKLDHPLITSVGWLDHAEIKDVYRKMDISVVPSVWEEPFGMVALEAMVSGLAVVAAKVGGLQTIVKDGETGFLFEQNSAKDLATKLEILLDDPGRIRAMAEAGRQRASDQFTWGKVVPRAYTDIFV